MVKKTQTKIGDEGKVMNYNLGKLSILISPSHGGKSTYAKQWQRQLSNVPRVVVTTDNIRLALTGQIYNKHSETVVFSHKHIMIKTLLLENYEVLVSGTHSSKESVKRILEIDSQLQFILLDTPLETYISRAINNGNEHMIPVIKRQYRQIQQLLTQGLENVRNELLEEIKIRWNKQSEI